MPSFFKWDMPSRFDLARDKELKEAAIWTAVCKVVDARDKRRCRACGKPSRVDAIGLTARGHRHHIQLRSAGGPDESWNLITLCSGCHNDVHQHRLLIDGNADAGVEFWRRDDGGHRYLARREIAPHVIEKD